MSRNTSITSVYKHRCLTLNDVIAGGSMRDVIKLANSVAPHNVNILITGENGTGKNLLALGIHNASPRAQKTFVSVNCSALTETLLESELFGHEKGSFTNADRTRKGKFELANEGTLFLDEIGDMSISAQVKIMRAVEYGEYERIGGETTLQTNARLICATNRDLIELIDTNKFRSDLFFRLKEVLIEIPPLRDRAEDIPKLAERFLKECNKKFEKKIPGFSAKAIKLLQEYNWPGNIREMRNVIKFVVAVSPDNEKIGEEHIENQFLQGMHNKLAPTLDMDDGDLTLKSIESQHIERLLQMTGNNKKRASELLGISRPTLDRKLKEYSINLGDNDD